MDWAQSCFEEFDKHLTADEKPSLYFAALLKKGAFPAKEPFTMLTDLVGLEQSPVHHPEGDVWTHTMLVVDSAAQVRPLSHAPRVLMWAALLHDIGKKPTTRRRRGRITAYNHDRVGAEMSMRFLTVCGQDEAFVHEVSALVRWHMQALYESKKLPFFNPRAMMAQTDIGEVALLCLCDRLGRGAMSAQDIEREKRQIAAFIEQCKKHV